LTGAPPLVARASLHSNRAALVVGTRSHTYRDLDEASHRIATHLLAESADLHEARVAFLIPPSFEHVAVQWGIWRAGGIAVPLAVSHPPGELEHVIRDAEASIVIAHPRFAEMLEPLAELAKARFLTTLHIDSGSAGALPQVNASRRALMVYTSGTTGKPKGAVHTHANIAAQITALVTAWEWTQHDRILLVLPLHHVHGIINVLCCALWSGATCEVMPAFDAEGVWTILGSGRLTLFMAVPTTYHRLIAAWEAASEGSKEAKSRGCRNLRLMVSGSAALPIQTLERWREISGHVLLERYGMTEIGMALSNPLHGERRPGFVGTPLPDVEVRIVDEHGNPVPNGTPGEIEVRGPNVFLEYWRRPEETRQAFRNGWFRTGDTAVLENGAYRILGRSSVDIIKTGGYKVSALEIEETLRTHPSIADCAVVGVADAEWGERVCAAVELIPGADVSLNELQTWAKQHLAPYKIPKELRPVGTLPRNAMGKVVKPDVTRLFARSE
jgi:malonyl-CoA/methylmalonyl-CoA synthetase